MNGWLVESHNTSTFTNKSMPSHPTLLKSAGPSQPVIDLLVWTQKKLTRFRNMSRVAPSQHLGHLAKSYPIFFSLEVHFLANYYHFLAK